jgi:UDP-N-acetyl-D-galactosamine dehydrogenase
MPISKPAINTYNDIILAVARNEFVEIGVEQIRSHSKTTHVFYNLKYVFTKERIIIKKISTV